MFWKFLHRTSIAAAIIDEYPPLLSFLPKSQIKDLSPLCLEILLLFYFVTNTIIKELNVK